MFSKWRYSIPNRNEWKLSKSCRWLYKDIELSRFSKNGIFRFNFIFFAKYNFSWKQTKELIDSSTRKVINMASSYQRYNFLLFSFSYRKIKKN